MALETKLYNLPGVKIGEIPANTILFDVETRFTRFIFLVWSAKSTGVLYFVGSPHCQESMNEGELV